MMPKKLWRNFALSLILTSCLMFLFACSSDSDNNNADKADVSGVAAKGPFQKGTQVQAYPVQATGERGESIWSGEIQDQGGTFSFTPNDHTGLIELVVNGTCLNELTDQMMKNATSLSAMFFLNDSLDEDIEVNINMATSMVAERCRHLLQEGWEPEDAFNRANSETATFFQNFLDLNSTSVEMITKGQENLSSAFNLMDIQEKPANGKFLLFNAALLQVSQDDNYPIQKVLEFLSTNNAFSASKTLTLSPSQSQSLLADLTSGGLAKLQSLELDNPVQNRIANLIEQALNQNGTASDMVDFLQGTQHFAGNCTDLAFPDYSPALVTKTNAAGVAKAGNSTITVETDVQDKEGNDVTVKSTNDTVEAELVSPDYTYGGASGQSGQDLYFAVQKVDPNKMPVEAKQTDCPECDKALANQNATQAPSNGTLQKPTPKVIASSNAKAQVVISDMQLGKDITVAVTPYKAPKYIPFLEKIHSFFDTPAFLVSGADINVVDSLGTPLRPEDSCFCAQVTKRNTNFIGKLSASTLQAMDQNGNFHLLVLKNRTWQEVYADDPFVTISQQADGIGYRIQSEAVELRLYPYVFVFVPDANAIQFTAQVQGVVENQAGEKIPGALVSIVDSEARTQTDQDGTFSLPYTLVQATSETIELRVQKYGYISQSKTILIDQDSVNAGTITLAEQNFIQVYGQVLDASDQSPLSGAKLTLSTTESVNASESHLGYTDSEGWYLFDDLPLDILDTAVLSAQKGGYLPGEALELSAQGDWQNATSQEVQEVWMVNATTLAQANAEKQVDLAKEQISPLFSIDYTPTEKKDALSKAMQTVNQGLAYYPSTDTFEAYKALLEVYDLLYGNTELNTLLARLESIGSADDFVNGLAKYSGELFYPEDIVYYRDLFSVTVLNRLQTALDHLEQITDPSFSASISLGGVESEMDASALSYFQGLLYWAKAFVQYGLAHDLSIDSETENGATHLELLTNANGTDDPTDQTILKANPNLFTLKSDIDYQLYFNDAKSDFSAGIDSLIKAITTSLEEDDDQSDDLTGLYGFGDTEQAKEFLTTLQNMKSSLTSGTTTVHINEIELDDYNYNEEVYYKVFQSAEANLQKVFDGTLALRDLIPQSFDSFGEAYVDSNYLNTSKFLEIFPKAALETDSDGTYDINIVDQTCPQAEILKSDGDSTVSSPTNLDFDILTSQVESYENDKLYYQYDGVPLSSLAKAQLTWNAADGAQQDSTVWVYRGDDEYLQKFYPEQTEQATLLLRKGSTYTVWVRSASENAQMEWVDSEFSEPVCITVETEYEVSGSYLHYRTFDKAPFSDRFRGWIGFEDAGQLIEESALSTLTLKDPQGQPVTIESPNNFYKNEAYYYASWNESSQALENWQTFYYSGFTVEFPEGTSLPTGSYTYEATMADGQTLSTTLDYPGKLEIEPVSTETMSYQWNPDGSLTLSWGAANGSFDDYRIELYDVQDNSWEELLHVRVPASVLKTGLTIPQERMAQIKDLKTSSSMRFQIQTRAYTEDGLNYARGYSDDLEIPWDESNYLLAYRYLQSRNYENPDDNEFRAWVEFQKNGQPVEESMITSLELQNSQGEPVSTSDPSFWDGAYYWSEWNHENSSLIYSGTFSYAGFSLGISDGVSVGPGNYTFKAVTDQDEILTSTVSFPVAQELTPVATESMSYQWNADGSLTLDWTPPADWSENFSVTLLDEDWEDLLYIDVPNEGTPVTIPSELITKLQEMKQGSVIKFRVQTREYSETGLNYARSYSDVLEIPWSEL